MLRCLALAALLVTVATQNEAGTTPPEAEFCIDVAVAGDPDDTVIKENNLNLHAFDVHVECKYGGSATVTACAKSGEPYHVSGCKQKSGDSLENGLASQLAESKTKLSMLQEELAAERQKSSEFQDELLEKANDINDVEKLTEDLKKLTRELESNGQKKDDVLDGTYRLLRSPVLGEAKFLGLPNWNSAVLELKAEDAEARLKKNLRLSSSLKASKKALQTVVENQETFKSDIEKHGEQIKSTSDEVAKQDTLLARMRKHVTKLEGQETDGMKADRQEREQYVAQAGRYQEQLSKADKELAGVKDELEKSTKGASSDLAALKLAQEETAQKEKRMDSILTEQREAMKQNAEMEEEARHLSASISAQLKELHVTDKVEPSGLAHSRQLKRFFGLVEEERRKAVKLHVNITAVQYETNSTKDLVKSVKEQEEEEDRDSNHSLVAEQKRRANLTGLVKEELKALPQLMDAKAKVAEAQRQNKKGQAKALQVMKLEEMSLQIQAERKNEEDQLKARLQAAQDRQDALTLRRGSSSTAWEQKVDELREKMQALNEQTDNSTESFIEDQRYIETNLSEQAEGVKSQLDVAEIERVQKEYLYRQSEIVSTHESEKQEQARAEKAEEQLRLAKEQHRAKIAELKAKLDDIPATAKKAIKLDKREAEVNLAKLKADLKKEKAQDSSEIKKLEEKLAADQESYEKAAAASKENFLKKNKALIKEVEDSKVELSKMRDRINQEPAVAEGAKEKLRALLARRVYQAP